MSTPFVDSLADRANQTRPPYSLMETLKNLGGGKMEELRQMDPKVKSKALLGMLTYGMAGDAEPILGKAAMPLMLLGMLGGGKRFSPREAPSGYAEALANKRVAEPSPPPGEALPDIPAELQQAGFRGAHPRITEAADDYGILPMRSVEAAYARSGRKVNVGTEDKPEMVDPENYASMLLGRAKAADKLKAGVNRKGRGYGKQIPTEDARMLASGDKNSLAYLWWLQDHPQYMKYMK